MLRDNPEQADAFSAAGKYKSIVIEALAGTGKTTVLKLIATKLVRDKKRVLYLAFNSEIVRATAIDAKGHYDCYTAHGLAYRNVGPEIIKKFQDTQEKFLLGRDLKKHLNVPKKFVCQDFIPVDSKDELAELSELLEPKKKGTEHSATDLRAIPGSVLLESIEWMFTHFQKSDQLTLDREFVANNLETSLDWPWCVLGFAKSELVIDFVWGRVCDYWRRTIDINDIDFPLSHDAYLKIWQISKPVLNYDAILFDEAQDADPLMMDIVQNQRAQVIWCGDSQQQIYSWRGAINTLSKVERSIEISITTTQRFGEPIAAVANAFLSPLGGLQLKPNSNIESTQNFLNQDFGGWNEPVELELFRTNSALLIRFVALVANGYSPRVLCDLDKLRRLLEGLISVARDEATSVGPFAVFADFSHLINYVNKLSRRKMKQRQAIVPSWLPDTVILLKLEIPHVGNIFECPPPGRRTFNKWYALLNAIDNAKGFDNERNFTLATAHKAKGLTCDVVWVHSDFVGWSVYDEPRTIEDATDRLRKFRDTTNGIASAEEEQRLCYVAVTRARTRLIHSFNIIGLKEMNEIERIDDCGGPIDVKDVLPTLDWVRQMLSEIDTHQSNCSPPQVLEYRVRFTGWTKLGGSPQQFRFDVTMDKNDKPRSLVIQNVPTQLVEVVREVFEQLTSGSMKDGIDLPSLTSAALRDLEIARKYCVANGTLIEWKISEHLWQVSIWDANDPNSWINLPFSKRGLNVSHLSKYSGDFEVCQRLVTLISEGLQQS